jgi:hypothetical protein
MGSFRRILRSNFFIKLRSWEYWPFGIIQAPLFLYCPWLMLKARSVFFFSASNPGILMGGMFGESKFDVQEKIPAEVKVRTILMKIPCTSGDVMERMAGGGFSFPLIFKPELGERGWMVRRINGEDDIVRYLAEIKINFLIQEFIGLPLEFGVFYERHPGQPEGRVTSIVRKEMLSVTGDGKRSLRDLILDHDRAKLQWPVLQPAYRGHLQEIVDAEKKIELISIGNHCLGTKFLNGNHLITEELSRSFDRISKQIGGFYFGRFDLRTASVTDLEKGKVMVMELNGCGAEPAHIYDPRFSLWQAIAVLFRHWRTIYQISAENHANGTPYISFREGSSIFRRFRRLTAE